jgi:hypothetical protein
VKLGEPNAGKNAWDENPTIDLRQRLDGGGGLCKVDVFRAHGMSLSGLSYPVIKKSNACVSLFFFPRQTGVILLNYRTPVSCYHL